MHLILNIIFGGMIIVLANKSTTTHTFTSWPVSVMISSLNVTRPAKINHVSANYTEMYFY